MVGKNKALILFLGLFGLNTFFRVYRYLGLDPDIRLYYQLLSFVCLFLLGSWLYRGLFKKDLPKLWQWKNLYILPLLYLLDLFVQNLAALLQAILIKALDLSSGIVNTAALSRANQLLPIPVIMLIVGICAPVVEELVYRKWLMDRFKSFLPVWGAVFLQGLVFGLAHVQSLEISELVATIPYIASGIFAGYLYHKTDNIYLPIILHCLNNLLVGY